METSEELIAKGSQGCSIRKQKIVDGLVDNDSCMAQEVMKEQSIANNTSASKKPVEQHSGFVTKKRKKCTAQKPKSTPIYKCSSLAKDLGKIEPSLLREEIKGLFTSQFSDSREFVSVVCVYDQPLCSIV